MKHAGAGDVIAREKSLMDSMPPVLWRFLGLMVALQVACIVFERFYKRLTLLRFNPFYHPFRLLHPVTAYEQWYPDVSLFASRFEHFRTVKFFTFDSPDPFMYPAPVAVVYAFLFRLGGAAAVDVFLGFVVLVGAVSTAVLCRAMVRRGLSLAWAALFLLVTIPCFYPIYFEFEQANMEVVIWAVVAVGVIFFARGSGYSAAVCFGLAAAMKIYPVVFLALFLRRRKFREIGAGLLTLATSTIVSLWLVYPSVPDSWRYINKGLDQFRLMYMLQRRVEIGFDHSLFALWKRLIEPMPSTDAMAHALTVYLSGTAIVGVAIFFLRILKLPLINQVLCLTVAAILFPPVSFEYTLIQLLVPWAMLVLLAVDLWARRRALPKGFTALLTCCGLVLAPLPEIVNARDRWGGQGKAVLLLLLFVLGLVFPIAGRDEAEGAEAAA